MNKQQTDKARENRLRRLAKRKGYRIVKDRVGVENQTWTHNGGYQIRSILGNTIEAGQDFELSLDRVEECLNAWGSAL